MKGKVYLVGAGPGDPELITVKAARLLAQAQVVVYDYLANPALLELAPDEAERVYVGKQGGDHSLSQEGINALLVELGRSGQRVVRLKGGDPYVFGRGGEEASALRLAGIPFQVVPGVTSAIAAPAYAGIPVTDRRCTTEVAFVTGHEDPGKEASTIKWASLAGLGTLVFLMGVKNLPDICRQLMAHGKPGDTPAAAIRWGTTPRQETIVGTLTTLPGLVAAAGLKPPAITVVGQVVGLRDQLRWFDELPLFGKRVLVTRARGQASRLSRALTDLGAQVVEVPTIEIAPPENPAPLLAAIEQLEVYDWVLFTSANGVAAFFAMLEQAGKDLRALTGTSLGAIGPATAAALKQRGLAPELIADEFVAEGLLAALESEGLEGTRILLPRASQARDTLPEGLTARGALVDVVPAYRTVRPEGLAQRLGQALQDGLDMITFTASSTVENLLAALDAPDRRRLAELSASGALIVASIGPITSQSATRHGLTVHVQPDSYTIEALVAALVKRAVGQA